MAVAEKWCKRLPVMRLPLLFLYLILSLPATANPLTGASLLESVNTYASFGDHRTGGKGDRVTTNGLLGELEALKFVVEHQTFSLIQFFTSRQFLQIGDHQVDVFPHWFLKT